MSPIPQLQTIKQSKIVIVSTFLFALLVERITKHVERKGRSFLFVIGAVVEAKPIKDQIPIETKSVRGFYFDGAGLPSK